MVIDALSRFDRYCALHPLFSDLVPVLSSLAKFSDGTTPILNGQGSIIASRYETKPGAQCTIEGHRKFIDVQIVLSGEERIGYAPLDRCTPVGGYDREKDRLVLVGIMEYFTLRPGMFALLFPEDGHVSQVMIDKSSKVRKIVVKIPVS